MLERVTVNWPLKIMALGLAFAIWLSVTGETRIVRDFPVPLDIQLKTSMTLAQPPPTTVTARLRGPENLIGQADPLRMEVRLDLRDASPGLRNVQLLSDALEGVPAGLEIVMIEPDRLRLVLDRLARRPVPVVPTLLGNPPDGYAFYGAEVTPEELRVEGPEAQVQVLARLRTDPIRLDERTGPFMVRVGAIPENPQIRLVDGHPVEVRVEVDAAPQERVIDAVPVRLSGQVYEASVMPTAVRVTVLAPPSLLDRIGPNQMRAVADVQGLAPRPTPYDIPLHIEFDGFGPRELARLSVRQVTTPMVAVRLTGRKVVG